MTNPDKTWINVKDSMPEPGKIVECYCLPIRGKAYRIKLKWVLHEKPIKNKLGFWAKEAFAGTSISYWVSYSQQGEIVEWREVEEKTMTEPEWFDRENIAGFQTYPVYRVVFRDDRPNQLITKEEFFWAAERLNISVDKDEVK